MTSFSWSALQEENEAWVKHNFPDHRLSQAVLGIVEEFGELVDAEDSNEMKDALADIAIFAADTANMASLDLADIVLDRGEPSSPISSFLGKLSHHALKMEQGIRGDHREHLNGIRTGLVHVFRELDWYCDSYGYNLSQIVEETWREVVSKRNWKAS